MEWINKQWFLKYDPVFVENDSSQNNRKTYSNIALFQAAHDGDLDFIKDLFEFEEVDVNVCDRYFHTPLHIACFKGKKEVVEFLLENGARVDPVDVHGYTPFIYSLRGDFVEILSVLIRYNCNVNITYKKSTYTPLHKAIIKNRFDIFKELLTSKTIDVNRICKKGFTPLHVAIAYEREQMVKMLIFTGKVIDPNVVDGKGYTILHWAVFKQNLAILDNVLMMKGIDINCTFTNVKTPLHLACVQGNLKIVQVLLEKNVNVDAIGERKLKMTPLHWAAFQGYIKIVKVLIKYKSNVLSTNKFKQTPLHLAVLKNHIKVVKYLVKNDAEIYAEDEKNTTPWDIAVKKSRNRILDFFKSVINKENVQPSLMDTT